MLRPIGTQFEMPPVVDWWSSEPPSEIMFIRAEVLNDERSIVTIIKRRPLDQRFVSGVLTWCYADDGTPYTGDLP